MPVNKGKPRPHPTPPPADRQEHCPIQALTLASDPPTSLKILASQEALFSRYASIYTHIYTHTCLSLGLAAGGWFCVSELEEGGGGKGCRGALCLPELTHTVYSSYRATRYCFCSFFVLCVCLFLKPHRSVYLSLSAEKCYPPFLHIYIYTYVCIGSGWPVSRKWSVSSLFCTVGCSVCEARGDNTRGS